MPIESINPCNGERLATFGSQSHAEIDAILALASEAQRSWARTSFDERARCMRAAAVALRERKDDLARIMALEVGKPLRDGVAEVNKCALVCEYYAKHAERHLAHRTEATDASKSYVRFDPLGVV